jgi:hypothetical protein
VKRRKGNNPTAEAQRAQREEKNPEPPMDADGFSLFFSVFL